MDTGETKTLKNVNGIVLGNNEEDELTQLGNNNFVEANINFLNQEKSSNSKRSFLILLFLLVSKCLPQHNNTFLTKSLSYEVLLSR